MHSFHYQNGSLHCEDVDLAGLADEHGTPAYVYSATTIRDHYRRLDQALAGLDHGIEYAVKANSNLSVLKLLVDEGSGFDIVSGGELRRVIEAGGDPASAPLPVLVRHVRRSNTPSTRASTVSMLRARRRWSLLIRWLGKWARWHRSRFG